MKKVGVLWTLLFVLLIGFVSADNHTGDINSDVGFVCLEEQLQEDCSGADTIEELSLSILASPANLGSVCLSQLESKKLAIDDCYGTSGRCNIKDTAMAILALNHAGKDTSAEEAWLISQNRTADDLTWFLQQNSDTRAQCKISYEDNPTGTTITAYENKKLSGGAGSCLSLAAGSYWLEISSDCYDQTFAVECDQNFLATLIYKQNSYQTYYILDETQAAPASGTIELSPKSYCFGEGRCDYESTAWSILALMETNNLIGDYVPYLLAMENGNEKYLPKAFNYMFTSEQQYAIDLIDQRGSLDDFWLAPNSANNQFQDTALAYFSIKGYDREVDDGVEEWFGLTQEDDGCWAESAATKITDTAMVLWALEGRSFVGGGGTNGGDLPPRCESDGNFYCLNEANCAQDKVAENYWCNGLESSGIVCCQEAPSCDLDLGGVVCDTGTFCDGSSQTSSEGECCLSECVERAVESACEVAGGRCRTSCSGSYTESTESCDDADLECCVIEEKSGSAWWIWVLIILILVVLGGIAWVYREKIKLWWFKTKSGFKKDKGKGKKGGKPQPPKPGFPPVRRPPMPGQRMQHRAPSVPSPKSKKQLDDTFSKLKEMSK